MNSTSAKDLGKLTAIIMFETQRVKTLLEEKNLEKVDELKTLVQKLEGSLDAYPKNLPSTPDFIIKAQETCADAQDFVANMEEVKKAQQELQAESKNQQELDKLVAQKYQQSQSSTAVNTHKLEAKAALREKLKAKAAVVEAKSKPFKSEALQNLKLRPRAQSEHGSRKPKARLNRLKAEAIIQDESEMKIQTIRRVVVAPAAASPAPVIRQNKSCCTIVTSYLSSTFTSATAGIHGLFSRKKPSAAFSSKPNKSSVEKILRESKLSKLNTR